jgi:two-component system chemotaxis sensor kinase CheA
MEMFLTECREHLENLNNSLLEFEKDTTNKAAVDDIFRSMHTVKGMAATMGFDKINAVSHEAENLMDNVRKGKTAADENLVDILFRSFDALESLLDGIEKGGKEEDIDVSSIIEELSGYKGGKPQKSKKKKKKKAPKVEDGQPWINITLDEACQLKSVRAFIILKTIRDEVGNVLDTDPSEDEIKGDEIENEFKVKIETEADEAEIIDFIKGMPEVSNVEALHAEEGKTPAPEEEVKEVKVPKPTRKKQQVTTLQSIRVNLDRLDSVVNLVGELIINKSRLEEISKSHAIPDFAETVALNQRLMGELQYEIMQMRMVPIEQIYNRFPRTVRDLSKGQGKVVNFIMEGGDIEVDRTILEKISEPLLHLIRNSIDHAIETPQERKKQGKSKSGLLKIMASRERDHVALKIEDDGKGIDAEKVKKSAIEKGVIEAKEAEDMQDSDILRLIFMPGFSTVEKVSKVSGRGVGMDVVKSEIDGIGGSVNIESEVGKGTTVMLKLPLTLAIIQALLVELGGERYAIPLSNINRIVDVSVKDVKSIKNNEVIKIFEEVIPLVKLHDIEPDRSIYTVVIIERGIKKVGLIVDDLVVQREIVIKALDPMFSDVKGVSGATILGDGKVALILDTASLVNQEMV